MEDQELKIGVLTNDYKSFSIRRETVMGNTTTSVEHRVDGYEPEEVIAIMVKLSINTDL